MYISKYFRESLGIRDNESRLYIRLCDEDIHKEKKLKYLQSAETLIRCPPSKGTGLGLYCLPITFLRVPRLPMFLCLNMLGFNDTSTLVGHFVLSPREREKRDRRDSRGDEREEQGRKKNRNESEETEEIKTFPIYPYLLKG